MDFKPPRYPCCPAPPTQVDMDWGQRKVRERELQEAEIEATAKKTDDGVFFEPLRKVLEVFWLLMEHFVPVTVKKVHGWSPCRRPASDQLSRYREKQPGIRILERAATPRRELRDAQRTLHLGASLQPRWIEECRPPADWRSPALIEAGGLRMPVMSSQDLIPDCHNSRSASAQRQGCE